MEALAKMFFTFLSKDTQMRAGVFQSINFVYGLDARLRAIEAKLGIVTPPLSSESLPAMNGNSDASAH